MAKLETPKWSHGYRTDLEYTFGLYGFLNPDLLLLQLALLGVDPIKPVVSAGAKENRNLTYCELGSGQGMSLNFMAARDPGGTYIGIDYNPAQVKNARNFAEAANLSNVTFIEESFENLDDLDVPDLDIVVLHGIWSWISKDMRDKIVQFLRKRLKPGGLCYNSYNCTVGRSVELPMRRLLIAAEKANPDSGANSVSNAIDIVKEISEGGAGYFSKNTSVKTRLDGFSSENPAYLIHEYLNEDWHPFFFHEVAGDLNEAKLDYVGQIHMARNIPNLALPAEAQPQLSRFKETADRELLKDIWSNSSFRQDIYVKGSQSLKNNKRRSILEGLRFTLAIARDKCLLKVKFPGGVAILPENPYAHVLDRLEGEIILGSDIAQILKDKAPKINLSRVISVLLAAGYISLAADKAAVSRISRSLAGFDTAVGNLANMGVDQFLVTLPTLASFKRLTALNYYIWQATVLKKTDRERYVSDQLKASGRELRQNNSIVSDRKQAKAIIQNHLKVFDKVLLPQMNLT